MRKLKSKLIIRGKIKTHTGLHIGGSKTALDIGGVDLNIIKSPQGLPFIPGSSLKGKMRSLLAKIEGSSEVSNDSQYMLQLFGSSGDSDDSEPARLLTRDAYLDAASFRATFEDIGGELELGYSDIKVENTIDRKTGTAKHPRQLERIPAGAMFDFELVYDIYDDAYLPIKKGGKQTMLEKHFWGIAWAMKLLQNDYLGGHGSRGYGKISFEQVQTDLIEVELPAEDTEEPAEQNTPEQVSKLISDFSEQLQKIA